MRRLRIRLPRQLRPTPESGRRVDDLTGRSVHDLARDCGRIFARHRPDGRVVVWDAWGLRFPARRCVSCGQPWYCDAMRWAEDTWRRIPADWTW